MADGTHPTQSTELARLEPPRSNGLASIREAQADVAVFDTRAFEHMQRVATLMAHAPLVPQHLKGNNPQEAMGNCFLIVNQARTWNADPFAVAQATFVVKGKLGYEGKLIAAILQSRYGVELAHKFEGKEGSPDRKITLWDPKNPERTISGTVGAWRTQNEMWKTQPDDQLIYRGTRQWARRYKPAAIMGIYTPDELEAEAPAPIRDITPPRIPKAAPKPTPAPAAPDPEVEMLADQAGCLTRLEDQLAICATEQDLQEAIEAHETMTDGRIGRDTQERAAALIEAASKRIKDAA